jgi:hypothetical protein
MLLFYATFVQGGFKLMVLLPPLPEKPGLQACDTMLGFLFL